MSIMHAVEKIPVYWWGVVLILVLGCTKLLIWRKGVLTQRAQARMLEVKKLEEERKQKAAIQKQQEVDKRKKIQQQWLEGKMKDFDTVVSKHNFSTQQKIVCEMIRSELIDFLTRHKQYSLSSLYLNNSYGLYVSRWAVNLQSKESVYMYRDWFMKLVSDLVKTHSLPKALKGIVSETSFTVLAEYAREKKAFRSFTLYGKIRKK